MGGGHSHFENRQATRKSPALPRQIPLGPSSQFTSNFLPGRPRLPIPDCHHAFRAYCAGAVAAGAPVRFARGCRSEREGGAPPWPAAPPIPDCHHAFRPWGAVPSQPAHPCCSQGSSGYWASPPVASQ